MTDGHNGLDQHQERSQLPAWARPTLEQPATTDRDGTTLAGLRAEVGALVRELTGPVSRVAVQAGSARIEIEWDLARSTQTAQVAEAPEEDPAEPEDASYTVTAPLVGTFYTAPEPGADPFVRPGDQVRPGQTVGIVEAMKIMNQITCEHAGQVTEFLAGNGEPVAFGQELVRIALMSSTDDAESIHGKPTGGHAPTGEGTDGT